MGYIERIKTEKTPHERRQIALRFAGVITAFLFVGWVATLGVRFNWSAGEISNTQNTAATLQAVQDSSLPQ